MPISDRATSRLTTQPPLDLYHLLISHLLTGQAVYTLQAGTPPLAACLACDVLSLPCSQVPLV